MKDEKLYTLFWVSRSGFLVTLIFDFLTLGGSLAWTGCAINVNFLPKFQKFNNLSKTVSFVEIFQRELKKFCLVTPKNVKNWHFLVIFSTKTRHNFAVVLATSIKGGSKWNIIVIFDELGNFQILVSLGAEILGYELRIECIKPIFTWYKMLDFSSLYGWILFIMILNDVLQNFTAIGRV